MTPIVAMGECQAEVASGSGEKLPQSRSFARGYGAGIVAALHEGQQRDFRRQATAFHRIEYQIKVFG